MRTLSPDRWRRVKEYAAAALDRDGDDRERYIVDCCSGDPDLQAEVRSLVASCVAATPYFEHPAQGMSPRLFAAGAHIGPYRLVRELATGGMGSVYLAERDDGEFQQRVAIKIVRGGFASQFLLERFRDERRILASLEHPNISRLLDGGTTDTGLPYVAMEYVEGHPIDRFCTEGGLGLRERLGIFVQVCAAVEYAHRHLVIHRDIKPGNILVTGDGTPKLLDFGIAKLLDSETGLERSTYTTMRVMTPESASPEQLEGKPVTVAVDVYALGVLLYRLAAGRSPYGDTPLAGADLIRVVCEQVPDPPSAHAPVPPDVDMIVMKALRKEPERRYASVAQLSEDVRRFLEGRPVLASPDSFRYRAGKFVSRHRVGVSAAAALVVAIGAGVAATVWQARAANRERVRAERELSAVRRIAQSMLGEVHDAVSKVPGSTQAREILLRRGTEYLDALSAEATGDDTLRRELSQGYLQLSRVQGSVNAQSLGDRAAAMKSLEKAVALLEPIARRPGASAEDRVRLATLFAATAQIQSVPAKHKPLEQARAILDTLSADEARVNYALVAREMVWQELAGIQIAAHDYAGAEVSQRHFLDAAEEHARLTPHSMTASFNLSLAYKYLGATIEMLNRRPEAIALYQKALALDEARVAAEPWRTTWRLDLSFSEGSIASARLSDGDLDGARAGYERTVEARELAVKQDPHDDFAKASLARGYERLGGVYARLGLVPAALATHDKALRIYLERLDAHPERDQLWHDYAGAAFADVEAATEGLPSMPADVRRRTAVWASATLDHLQSVQARWTKEKHAGALAPASNQIEAQRAAMAAAR